MHKRTIQKAVLFALLAVLARPAAADDCGAEQYFAPEDVNNSTSLRAPHGDFRKAQALAREGNAAEERNLASFYEAGFLVSPCHAKAAYWYERAARGGDQIAKAWVDRASRMARLRRGPSCFGNSCFVTAGGDGAQAVLLRPDRSGTYKAAVSINGKPVTGLIDTGASYVSMSVKTANELGLAYSTGRQVQLQTANGVKMGRAVMIASVTVENITLGQVQGVVSEGDQPLLVGMSFLSRVTMSASNGGMTLAKR